MNSIKSILEKITFSIKEDIEIDFEQLEFSNLPDEDGEQLSTENITFIDIRENEMDVVVGGDWQRGAMLTVIPDLDNIGKLKVISIFRDIDWTKLNYMTEEDVYEAINIL